MDARRYNELTDGRTHIDAYGCPPSDLRVSPLLASSHAGLPPAFIQVQEFDPVHDEGVLYEKVLREAEVPVKLIE